MLRPKAEDSSRLTVASRHPFGMTLNVRKLAAIDLYFLGPVFIVGEFVIGVVGLGVLGLLTLRSGVRHSHSTTLIFFGTYMLALALNYIPLLLCAIGLARSGTAKIEIASELIDRGAAMRKYRRQSLYILVPFAIVIACMYEEIQRRGTQRRST